MNSIRRLFKIAVKGFLLILFAVYAGASGCNDGKGKTENSPGESQTAVGMPQLVFAEYEHDFGKIVEGEKVAYGFRFENKGTADLIIKSAKTTCGCTVPSYDRQPVKTGKTETM